MPELPEVEITRRGILPLIRGKKVARVITRVPALRLPLDSKRLNLLCGRTLLDITRRAKYLLFHFTGGWLLVHLGMSGSLRYHSLARPPVSHDHLDIRFVDGSCLRLRDPRRFGLVLYLQEDPSAGHPLLSQCGPEPFSADLNAGHFHRMSRGKKAPIQSFLLDQKIVAGLGNIYVNEALFVSGIDPQRPAGRISPAWFRALVDAIRNVLGDALEAGGTTLRDFRDGEGKPGYFSQKLRVYGRTGCPCPRCGATVVQSRIHQRSVFYCPFCQK